MVYDRLSKVLDGRKVEIHERKAVSRQPSAWRSVFEYFGKGKGTFGECDRCKIKILSFFPFRRTR